MANDIYKDSGTGIQVLRKPIYLYIRYQTNKPLFRQTWAERRTKRKEKEMSMLSK